MYKIGIFLHIGNVLLWDEINDYIKKIDENKISLYINFCKDLISQKDINEYKKIIKNEYKNTVFFENDNKGCDIGPFFLFLSYLRDNKIQHDWILKLHTKSNKKWRNNLLNNLFTENFNQLILKLENNNIPIHGAYPYPYDYFNIKYDLKNLELLNLDFKSNWNSYIEKFPETKNYNLMEKRYHSNKDIRRFKYTPDIDVDLYNYLFNNYKKDHELIDGRYKWSVIQKILGKDIKLFYYPGTFLLFKHNVMEEIFKNNDYNKIYNSLEENKLDDNIKQSNTHSWERIIPLSFILHNRSTN
jgi:hypothetical protein